jgi:ABC-type branched-subunit amino acid transport system substrate-binding protein
MSTEENMQRGIAVISRFFALVLLWPLASFADPAAVPGFDGKTIKLGVVAPLSGAVAAVGTPVVSGNQVWFQKLNDRGGVAGRYKVELIIEDHANSPALAVQRYTKIKDSVVLFAQMFGTPTTSAVQPLLKNDNVVMSPTSFDNLWVRDPHLLPLGATYQIMAANGLDYYLRTEAKPSTKLCAMIQDNPYGQAGSEGVNLELKLAGRALVQTASFALTDQDFTGPISQLQDAGCEFVFVTTVPGQLARIAANAARVNFSPRWLAQWPSWHSALIKNPAIDYIEEHVWLAGEGPEWGDTSAPGMKELLADMQKYKSDQGPDIWFTYGYNQGRAVTALLEKAVANNDLSRPGMMRALNEMPDVDFGGLTGPHIYGSIATRELPRESSVFAIDRTKSFGLKALKTNITSDAARAFTF